MYDPKTVGNAIAELRKEHGLSQEELAEKLFVTRQAVSKWERGNTLPETENLLVLSETFDVTVDALLRGNIRKNKNEIGKTEPKEKNSSIEEKNGERENADEFGVHLRRAVAVAKKEAIGEIERCEKTATEENDKEKTSPEDEKTVVKIRIKKSSLLRALPYPVIVCIAFFLWGFYGGWAISWTLFITIPVYYSVLTCVETRKFTPFAYPVFVTFLFLLFGMLFHVWHALWIIYLTIPVYYPLAATIDNRRKRQK